MISDAIGASTSTRPMKLLSLWQPWASLIAIGAKRVETRGWQTPYRGWIAIHASSGGLSQRDFYDTIIEEPFFSALGLKEGRPILNAPKLPRGCIVAVVNLVECCPVESFGCLPALFHEYPDLDTPQERAFGLYEPEKPGERRWGWVTDQLFRLPTPILYRGSQGLRDLDPETTEIIRDQWRGLRACAEGKGKA